MTGQLVTMQAMGADFVLVRTDADVPTLAVVFSLEREPVITFSTTDLGEIDRLRDWVGQLSDEWLEVYDRALAAHNGADAEPGAAD